MKSLINSKISIMGFPWVRLLSYVTYRMSNSAYHRGMKVLAFERVRTKLKLRKYLLKWLDGVAIRRIATVRVLSLCFGENS